MPWLFWVALAIWIIGAVYSWIYGGRKLPIITFVLGALTGGAVHYFQWNVWITAIAMMVLALLVWIVSTTGFTQDV